MRRTVGRLPGIILAVILALQSPLAALAANTEIPAVETTGEMSGTEISEDGTEAGQEETSEEGRSASEAEMSADDESALNGGIPADEGFPGPGETTR